MTSMLLMERMAPVADMGSVKKRPPRGRPVVATRSFLFGAVARANALLLRVLGCGRLDHRTHDRLVGRDPVADHVPALAVPLHELDAPAALVVHARDLERRHEAHRAELLQALLGDVEVLDPPAHLLAGDRLALAEALLRGADRLRGDDAVHDAARVVDRVDALLVLHLAFALL